MAIKRTSPLPLLGKNFNFNMSIENKLRYIGEEGIKYAKANQGFENQTYNLKDSYGYAIYSYGNIVGQPVVSTPQATDTSQGSGHDEAVDFLKNYNAHPEGWTLLVVAGMKYASFVEFKYSLDVLQGSELHAEQLANKIFRSMKWMSIKQSYDWED